MQFIRDAGRIIAATFLSISWNWSTVLRASFVPLLLPVGLLICWVYWAWTSGYARRYLAPHVGGQGDLPVFAICLALIAAIGTLYVAIAWHRFDLAGERPRLLFPRVRFGAILGYLGRTILLAIMTILIAIIVLLPVYPLVHQGPHGFSFSLGSLPTPLTTRNFVLNAALWSVVTGLMLRWSLILPAAALGRKLTLREARMAASRHVGLPTFLLLALFLHMAPIAIDVLLAEMGPMQVSTLLIQPFVMLFWFMFGIAMLTILYAHCVEGRPLGEPPKGQAEVS